MAGEVLGLALNAGRCGDDEVADELADGRPSGDLLRCDVPGGPQREVGVLVLAVLQERAGGVDEQACLAFGDGDLIKVDAAGGVDGGPGVAEGDSDVDAAQRDVRWP